MIFVVKMVLAALPNYTWKAKYGGLDAADIKRLKELEEENSKLKKIFAEVSLENRAIMRELFAKKLVLTEKKSCAEALVASRLSVIRACQLTTLIRSNYYRRQIDWKEKDSKVIASIQYILAKSP